MPVCGSQYATHCYAVIACRRVSFTLLSGMLICACRWLLVREEPALPRRYLSGRHTCPLLLGVKAETGNRRPGGPPPQRQSRGYGAPRGDYNERPAPEMRPGVHCAQALPALSLLSCTLDWKEVGFSACCSGVEAAGVLDVLMLVRPGHYLRLNAW